MTSLPHVWHPEIIHILPQLQLKLRLLCLLLLLSQGLSQSPRSSEVEAAPYFSFIRQMSPSQAMSNQCSICQAAPTWPGLQPSCVCCLSWIGTRGLPTQHLFFPLQHMQMLRLCLALSQCVCLSSHPTLTKPLK